MRYYMEVKTAAIRGLQVVLRINFVISYVGGTSFGKHLVHDLDLKRPCTCPISRKRCYCFRPHSNQSWLFSRYTTGWKCGLHADWTELTSCVDEKLDELEETVKRRYFYITLLRDPVARYVNLFYVFRSGTIQSKNHIGHLFPL